jgi:ABC-type antimicrobial peptide transport system permease subunit
MGFATLVPRMSASLLGGFAGLALLVASLGIYSVVSFVTSAKRRELGIRLAVGASPRSIAMLVIRQALSLTIGGVLLGLVLASALSRSIATLLVAVSPTDPMTFGAVVLVIVAATVAASVGPAVRVSRLDTMRTLRS